MSQRILQHTDLQHVSHHTSVIVLFRGQLRRVLQDPLVAPHLPFATNFEDEAGPILSRLFFYAEMTAASVSGFGCYSTPTGRAPQTYRQLHEHVFAQRAQHTSGAQAQRRVETADVLATMLQEFASDAAVLRALQNVALPPHQRKMAASVKPGSANGRTHCRGILPVPAARGLDSPSCGDVQQTNVITLVYPPALWGPCDPEHHSWAEAMKCYLWKADQVQGFPVLRAWRRRILTNFTAALTYSKPGNGHYGRTKVCMRHLVGCVTCARVNWIDNVVSCFLQSAPRSSLPRTTATATVQRTRTIQTTEKRRRQAEFFSERTQSATYVMQQPSTLSLTFENIAGHDLSFLRRNWMHPLSSTPRVWITAGFSTPGEYQC